MTRAQMETAKQTPGFLYCTQWGGNIFVVSMLVKHSDGRQLLCQYSDWGHFAATFGGGL